MDDDPVNLDTEELVYWVMELRQGRPQAAEPICRKIVVRVEELAQAMFMRFPRVGRFVDVDDVVQNCLIRLLAACRATCPTSRRHFYALTSELIRRELLDLTRHYFGPRGDGANLVDVAVGEGDREYAPAGADPDPAEWEQAAAFHQAVEELPAREREVIGLAYYHGWPQAEIAGLFQVSVRTVQRWQESGVAHLRRALRTDE
jgi:RNA polymerase sigma factor (sigma-70 family)